MAELDPYRFRERERHWREQAVRATLKADRATCEAIADGYAELINIIERPNTLKRSSQLHGGDNSPSA